MGKVTSVARNWGDVVKILRALRNKCTTASGLTNDAVTTTAIKTVNTLQYMVDGKLYSKVATSGISISSLTATGAATQSKVRVEIDSTGAFGVVQGVIDAPGDKFPLRSASKATVGWFTLPNSFTPGTSNTNLITDFTDGDPDIDAGHVNADLSDGGLEA